MNEITLAETQRLEVLEATIERGMQTFVDVGNALLEIRDSRLYKQYGTFEDYCRERWGMERRHAYRMIDAAQVVENVSNWTQIPGTMYINNPATYPLPTTESQARPLATLEPEQQREAWQRAVETAPNGKVTAAHVQSVVSEMIDDDDDEPEYIPEPTRTFVVLDEWGTQETIRIEDDEELTVVKKPHVANNSGNNEWYTPAEYIEAARKVMGRIDLDPASSAIANKTVKATIFYTVDDDGLAQYWEGNVWMNPPYAGELIGQFVAKLVYHVQQYDVREAIVLVNNATETAWFQELITEASAVAFPRARVRFWKPDGTTGAPLQGQAIVYIGQNDELFRSEFSSFGWVAHVDLC